MPPRNPELPEGTDHIINGAAELGDGTTSGLGGSTAAGGGSGSGFVGSGAGDDTGGMSSSGIGGSTGTSGTSGLGTAGGSGGLGGGTTGSVGLGGSGSGDFGGGSGGMGSSGGTGDIKAQVREGVSSIQQQAGEKVRAYAETGKTRATTALDDLSQVVSEAAGSIDERLGSEYGEYARRAADAVSGLADSLRDREVDQLFDDGRNLVRKSPGVALGAAAVIGFTLMRLIKSGMDSGGSRGEREVEFQPDTALTEPSATVVVERETTVTVSPSATTPTSGI
jgi:hypothetical protein